MGMKRFTKCERCGKEGLRYKNTAKVNGQRLCKQCYKENLRDIRESDRSIKLAGKYAHKSFNPNIRMNKRPKSYNLTLQESQVLFRQFLNQGFDEEQANKRINNLKSFERQRLKDLINKIKNEEELSKRFKKEFKKLQNGK